MKGLRPVLALTAAGAAVALVVAGRAPAKSPPPCAADVEKFCPGVPAGAGRILACLQEHASKLSPECQQGLETRKRHVDRRTPRPGGAAWVGPCMGDIQKLCKDVPAGAGRIAECLAQHRSELSDACKAAFPPQKGK